MSEIELTCVYGAPPAALAEVPRGAIQVSPLVPGGGALEDLQTGSLAAAVVAAPAGTLERRYGLAHILRALKPGASLTVMAPKDKGGSRLAKELAAFGCDVEESGRKHQRICETTRPAELTGLDEAIAAGAPRLSPELGLWTQPGVFSWDRRDPGSQLLLAQLRGLEGKGADLGCGLGVLAHAVLAEPKVTQLDLVDLDRRGIEAARRNVDDARVRFHWADVRSVPALKDLDFVVMNPPFHEAGAEDKGLGQAFIRRAHEMLRGDRKGKGGTLWLVANRHLPYERVLGELFARVDLRADEAGFKVYEARR